METYTGNYQAITLISLPGKLLKQSIAPTVWKPPWEARVMYVLWSCDGGDGQMETLLKGGVGGCHGNHSSVSVPPPPFPIPVSSQHVWNVLVWLEPEKGSIHRGIV